MAVYTLTQTAKTSLGTVVTNISNILTTINTDANAPYATADQDSDFAAVLNGYNSQLTKIYNELVRLEKNISAG